MEPSPLQFVYLQEAWPEPTLGKEDLQPRPQGLLLDDFQNGGSSAEDPGTQQKSRDRFVHGGWKFIQNGGQDKE